jgi:3-hydroxyacyl-CoA dehydrogenase
LRQQVEYETRNDVFIIMLNNPPVNALGDELRQGLFDAISLTNTDDSIRSIVLYGHGKCFCGGADIKEFGKSSLSPTLPEVIKVIENSSKPVIAALHGFAFGGGLELSLGCHYRIGTPSVQLGLPEVKLGLIPGAGGTQRLPRLIGVEPALNMILNGRTVSAEDALSLRILDALFNEDSLLKDSIFFALARAEEGGPYPIVSEQELAVTDTSIFVKMRKTIERRARGLIAPWHCIESIENAFLLPFDQGLAHERKLFLKCRDSEQSSAQRYVFFAEREAQKIPNIFQGKSQCSIKSAAVIGCGTMGAGIAFCFARNNIPVNIIDNNAENLKNGLDCISRMFAGLVKKNEISKEEMNYSISLVKGTSNIMDIKDVDIVIEAVFEEMNLKKKIFVDLDKVCKSGCILATNTSTLNVDEIAAATKRPDSVIGTHFFSPSNVMRLMENVRGKKTSKHTITKVMKLGKQLGKATVLVSNCDGFAGNRMYHKYSRQASFLLEEGALPEQVDKVIYEFGFAMGPFAVSDIAGLDVGWRIRKLHAKTRPLSERYSKIADKLCEMGRFGQKTGAGWYRYEGNDRTPIPDQVTKDVILDVSDGHSFIRREIGGQEILDRCLFVIINEGAKLIEEGIVLRASDIDIIWNFGYGFPIHIGGPMYYADRIGVEKVYDTLNRLVISHGQDFTPAPLLIKLAVEGKTFGDL